MKNKINSREMYDIFFSLERYCELYKITQVLNNSIVIHRFHRLQDATLFVSHLNTPSMET